MSQIMKGQIPTTTFTRFAPEVERIVDVAEGWEKSLVALYFFTGLRRGDGLGLTWNNVFPDDGHLIVTRSVGRYGRTKPKTTASRRKVQFGPRVRAELLAQRRRVKLSSACVFPNQVGSASISAGLRRSCGVESWSGPAYSIGRSGKPAAPMP
jgi:integrase